MHLTIEEIKKLTASGIVEARRTLNTMLNEEGADIEEIRSLIDALEERQRELQTAEEQRQALAARVAGGAGQVTESRRAAQTPSIDEIRSSEAYVNAFANYIRTGNSSEVRALLTENVEGGMVPVPAVVDGVINTAWENNRILSRVRRTNLKGNVKIGFEVSATGAAVHVEGTPAPAEEELILGIVTMVPETIKKWITFSDETDDLNGAAFVQYIYSELAYRIFKKAEDTIVAKILAAPQTATKTAPAVAKVVTSGISDIDEAFAKLSDEANDPVIILSKAREAYYKGLAKAANYAVDPFNGMERLYNDTLGNIVIVGDLKGVQANFPKGYDVTFKYDDKSLAEEDLIKVVGRMPVAIEVIASGRFTKITAS